MKKNLKPKAKRPPSSSPTVINMLRKRVAGAEAHLKQAREHKRQAKQRRKLAKLLAKRARKVAKQAKEELLAVRAALTKALAAAPKHRAVLGQTRPAKSAVRSVAPRAKKRSRPSRVRVRAIPMVPPPADEIPPYPITPVVDIPPAAPPSETASPVT